MDSPIQTPSPASTAPASSSKPSSSSPSSPEEAERVLQAAARAARTQPTYIAPRRLLVPTPPIPNHEAVRLEAERQLRIQAIQLRSRVDACLRECNVPKHYQDASLDDVAAVPDEDRDQYRNICEYLRSLQEHPVILALVGPRGPGKTHMACALINAFVRSGRSGKYMTAADYTAAIRGTWGGGAGADEKAVARHVAVELLVLDEMHERRGQDGGGRESRATEDDNLMLTRVIDKRYAANRATVLISNQDEDAFVRGVGASIADRINDGGGIITCSWPSLRGRLCGVQ